jgi:nitric oxide reductase NorE protein
MQLPDPSQTGQDTRLPGDTLPGDSGVWAFIIADMGAFAMFFLVFTVGRMAAPELYEASRQHLDATLGLLNTIILLTSSFFMVRAVEAARAENRSALIRNLLLTILIGLGFAVTKAIEYKAKGAAGIGLTTNEFYTYYFAFTGIHFLHFAIGIGALLMMLAKARVDVLDAKFRLWIESVGCYWHMVDLLWIMLFPLLYLLKAG